MCVYRFVPVHACVCVSTCVCMQRSEDTFQELVLSLHQVNPDDASQEVRHDDECDYQLDRLTGPEKSSL